MWTKVTKVRLHSCTCRTRA